MARTNPVRPVHVVTAILAVAAALLAFAAFRHTESSGATSPVPTVPVFTPAPSVSSAPLVTVGLGDSITQGNATRGGMKGVSWFGQLFTYDHRLRFAWNAGVHGDTTAGMLARFDADVSAHHPRLVTIMGGTNDVGQHVSQAVTVGNLRQIIVKVRAHHAIPVLATIMPRDDRSLLAATAALNRAIVALGKRAHVLVLRLHDVLAAPDGRYAPGLSDDGIHPNYKGHLLVAEAAAQQLGAHGY